MAPWPSRTLELTTWTIPYFYVQRTLVYNKDDPIKRFPEDITRDFRGTFDSTGWMDAQSLVEKKAPAKKRFLARGKTDEQDVNDLISGKIQGLMRGSFVGAAIIHRHPKQLAMVKPWDMSPKLLDVPHGECFAFPCHRDSNVVVLLSMLITEMWRDGDLDKLAKKYHLA
jgi:ABC-type amino acid transport substrate-binding protein